MPSWDAIAPLSPDACRSDRRAAGAYWHLKVRRAQRRTGQALRPGSRVRRRVRPRDPELVGRLAAAEHLTPASPSPEEALLRALIGVGDPGRARLDFLG